MVEGAIEKRLDEAGRSMAYHTQQAAEAHAPDIKIASLEVVAKRRREIHEITSEVQALERQAGMVDQGGAEPKGRVS